MSLPARHTGWRLAAAVPLLLMVAAPDPEPPASAGSTSGPAVEVRPERGRPGDRIDLSVSGFDSPWVTASLCGNNALRGSGDCNMVASEGNELSRDLVVSRFTMPVSVPPVDCPCVVRVVGADQSELAVVPFEVIGHPVSDLVEAPSLAGLVDAGVEATEEPAGFVAAMVASLGGDTVYEVTLSVRNRSPEALSAVSARGSALDADGNALVTFDMGTAPPIAPGQTWSSAARVTIPAPALGKIVWAVDVVGAGSALQAETSTRHRPMLLILLLCVAVLSVAGLIARRLVYRHAARSDAAAAETLADPSADPLAVDRLEVVGSPR